MNSIKILVVDDHAAVRQGLRSLLAARAHWTICGEASDGVEAVEKAKALNPDVILMDISMPRMDGLAATQAIRRESPATKVIIVSQNDPSVAKLQAKEVGAAAFVPKSQLGQELLPILDELIERNGDVSSTHTSKKTSRPMPDWLSGGGALGQLIAQHDWSKTPLGAIENWSQSLKTSINLILNSQHPMWIGWGPDATFLYNDAYIQVLSLAKHPWALGRPAVEVWSEIWDYCGPLVEKVFRKGEPSFVDEVRLFMNRGDFLEETYYSFSYSPIRDESGKVGGLFCPSTEVTPKVINARRFRTLSELSANALLQKTTEAACAAAIETLAKNPDDVPFAVLYLVEKEKDRDVLRLAGKTLEGVLAISPTVIELAGQRTELKGWPLADVVKSGQLEVVSLKDIAGLPIGPAQQPLTHAILLPINSRGDERTFGVLIAGVNPTRRLQTEYLTFFQLLVNEIAAAVQNARAEEDESRRLEALAELDMAKTAFFSNVSHEFRTPLTLMLGPLEDALAAPGALQGEQRERLEIAHRNSLRLLKLVNTLLDFSRIEAGRIQAFYDPTDLSALTAELASVFRSAAERAGLKLIIDCPSIAEPAYVDREMWEKIVFNLLSNAFKFTFNGEIEVSLRQHGESVELSVRDTGTGIPAEELPHLFERFYRVKGARGRSIEGSGIGLALVQELAKLHGGEVSVTSEPNRGSVFTVSVPLGKNHLPADRIGLARRTASVGSNGEAYLQDAMRWLPGGVDISDDIRADLIAPMKFIPQSLAGVQRPRILLADDNADMRDYVQRLLSAEYDVVSVSNGESALQSAREQIPDLILSDVMMPRLDGFGLLRAVRAEESLKGIPVILLSARAGEDSRIEGLHSGADDYLIKPFSARELVARVKSQLTLAHIRREASNLESKLAHDAKLLAAIVANSDDAIISKTLDGIITSWNQSAERIFGYTAEEAIGKSIMMIIPPDRQSEETLIIGRLRMGERVDHFETVRMRKDGSTLDVSLTISPIKDSHGKVIGASKVARDVTIQQRAEQAMRESEERFRAIVETTPECVKLITSDGTLLHMNSSGLQMIGASGLEQVVGKCVYDLIAPEHRERFRAFNQRICAGEKGSLEFDIVGLAGKRLHMETHAAPLHNPDGSVIQLGVTRDVSERKRAEENSRRLMETLEGQVHSRTVELEKRNAEVLRQSDLLREFSRRLMQTQDEERRHIARELHDSAGQTLTILGINLAQLVQKAGRKSPDLANDAEKIEDIVQQLHREIRTTSYLLHPPLLDESGLPSALSWYIQGLGERSELEINLDIPDQFGRLSRDIEIAVFRLVQEALTNIHRHSGSKTAEIKLAHQGDMVMVEIQDHGRGMSPEKLAEIQSQGSGVGIRGMRERLRQFGGNMNILSDSSGTRIMVMIPVSKTNPDEENRSEPLPAAV